MKIDSMFKIQEKMLVLGILKTCYLWTILRVFLFCFVLFFLTNVTKAKRKYPQKEKLLPGLQGWAPGFLDLRRYLWALVFKCSFRHSWEHSGREDRKGALVVLFLLESADEQQERNCGVYLYVDPPEMYWNTNTRYTYFLSWEIEAVKRMWIGKSCCLRPLKS